MHSVRHTIILIAALLGVFAVAPSTASAASIPVTITGAGRVVETTPTHLIDCSSPNVTPSGVVGAICTGSGYATMTYVMLEAQPAQGYTFAGWSGACSGTSASCVIGTGFGSTYSVTASYVDTVAPDTAINGGPFGNTRITYGTFTLVHTQEGSTFRCQLDQGAWRDCPSSWSVGPLVDGPHTANVVAVDPSGNVDPVPATRSWTVDTIAPTLIVGAGPTSPTNVAAAAITFGSSDSTAWFQCRLATKANIATATWSWCASPTTFTPAADGEFAAQIRAIDPAGNMSAAVERSWIYDTTAPRPTITSGPGSGMTTGTGTANLGYSFDEGVSSWECRIETPRSTSISAGCPNLVPINMQYDGRYAFSVRAIDLAGNQGEWTTRAWSVDATPPPAPELAGGPSTDSTTTAVQSFAVTDAEQGATLQCRAARAIDVQSVAWGRCDSPLVVEATSAGDWLFEARAMDQFGNTSTVTRRAWTFAVATPTPSPTPEQPQPQPQPTPVPSTPADTTAPVLDVRPPASVRIASRAAALRITCSEQCTLEAVALVAGRPVGAAVRSSAPARTARSLRITIPATIAAQARRHGSSVLLVRIVARDSSGNRTTRTIRVRVVR